MNQIFAIVIITLSLAIFHQSFKLYNLSAEVKEQLETLTMQNEVIEKQQAAIEMYRLAYNPIKGETK